MVSRISLPALPFLAGVLICAGCEGDAGREVIPPDEEMTVREEIQTAITTAQRDGKRVLLVFGADWCPDCRALDRMFAQEPVLAVLESGYHVVKIDVGRKDRNLDIVGQYDNPIAGGIPAVVILDGSGNRLVATKQGELANARDMAASEVVAFLRACPEAPEA